MTSHSGAYCQSMSENIYIFQGGSNVTLKRALQGSFKQKRVPKQARKLDTLAKAVTIKICYWQDSCNRTECRFMHLPARFLAGKQKPYKLCFNFLQPSVSMNTANMSTGLKARRYFQTKQIEQTTTEQKTALYHC